jgi:hypothetical protein
VDWTIVVTTAITGAVGVAGVAGGVITSRRSAQLNITAEADRARLADKRRIYARGIGTLDTAMLADGAARAAEKQAQSAEASGAAVAVVEAYGWPRTPWTASATPAFTPVTGTACSRRCAMTLAVRHGGPTCLSDRRIRHQGRPARHR